MKYINHPILNILYQNAAKENNYSIRLYKNIIFQSNKHVIFFMKLSLRFER